MSRLDQQWDKTIRIKTTGRDDSISDQFMYPYEPTPYSVLDRLTKTGLITKRNTVLDYGCGKGRVGFFLSHQTKCKSIGVEYNERLYEDALKNAESAISGQLCQFSLGNAETYKVPTNVDRCFFFNPFSEKTLSKVLARIEESFWEQPREIYLFFYFPSDHFLNTLASKELFIACEDINCHDLFPGNGSRERIAVYKVEHPYK